MTQTVIGIFDTPHGAHVAEERLISRGIDQSSLHIAAQDAAYGESEEDLRARHQSTTGGIRDFFSELFGPEHSEEAGHYAEAVRRGGVVLAVDVPDGAPLEPVRDTLLDAGAVGIDARVEQWRKQGYSGYNPEAQPYSADEVARERSIVLPVIQEEIEISKREVGKGTVRVYSRTVETPFEETVNLREEHASIQRRPVDRPVSQADLDVFGDKTVEVREMAEQAVVSKSARVVEEVEVGKEVSQHTETIDDTVRHTEINVERGPAGSAFTRSYEDFEPEYRQDFQSRYGSQGGSYDEYAPAYRYGHTMAGDPRYRGRDWATIEPQAQRDWERRYPKGTWEHFKQAIRHGWEKVVGDKH